MQTLQPSSAVTTWAQAKLDSLLSFLRNRLLVSFRTSLLWDYSSTSSLLHFLTSSFGARTASGQECGRAHLFFLQKLDPGNVPRFIISALYPDTAALHTSSVKHLGKAVAQYVATFGNPAALWLGTGDQARISGSRLPQPSASGSLW